ncbi:MULTISPECIES: CHAP domain-containing protein [unclassified Novosphingobium]|uniref:CHAP domain-containing protein n=1 Tax=unclassified Novosphingobium TaxID=2644732 RepID=UPI00135CE09F|nr:MULTISPECIES: CHAP domain-containing protein [unclassified Novosphingobium]
MELSRRTALGSLLATGAFGLAREVVADTPPAQDEEISSAFPGLPNEWKAYGDNPDVAPTDLSPVPLGTGKPLPAEIEIARKIMSASPAGTKNPLDVARYFADIGGGKSVPGVDGDVRHYVRGWPVRYNPVIVNFFSATKTNPLAISGDYTAWCAAFINWCVARSLSQSKEVTLDARGLMVPFAPSVLKGTDSASSGSFRCWSQDVRESPQPGDVIVWATQGTVNKCAPGKGHVGFYVGKALDGRFLTLGGNQRDPATNQSAVVEKRIGQKFSRSDGLVEFHSIRRWVGAA